MPPPTTARGLLGHFLRGTEPPTVDQRDSPPPVQSPTSSPVRAKMTARDGGGDARGGAGRHKSLRDGEGGVRGSGGEIQGRKGSESRYRRGGKGDNRGDIDDGVNREQEGGKTEDPSGGRQNDGAGRK